jgi:hypothetical protein
VNGWAGLDENGLFVHTCWVCGKGASFGFGVCFRKGEFGQWYCREHLQDERKVMLRAPDSLYETRPLPSQAGGVEDVQSDIVAEQLSLL